MELTKTTLAIHTDTPIMVLTRMVGEDAIIEVGTAITTGGPDCFYGWREPVSGSACLPHNVVWGAEEPDILWIAKTLARLGYQVVITAPDTDDQFGDHHVVEEMNVREDHTH